ncbi:Wzz/FepE/Etk N-terminal domain-containing protein [Novosphingobium resinovorum]|uniref:Wzz/FepE/Etk N-terminal domain-containing protein n=1 Tax=Novosphingobium resinovorum TaxID=158500 RepID=UPI002ED674BF|nr:Wzz/FepE/Etk N-terminal domain-containing protein [Novosphingobium resinovorum]
MNATWLSKALLVRWRIIAGFTLLGVVLAASFILLKRPVYKSTATIVAVVRAPETIGPQSVAEQLSSDYLLTQEDILKSDRVAQQVVQDVGVARQADAGRRFQWSPRQGPLADVIAKKLSSGLAVESSATNSRVMEISYLSGDPDFSAVMANAFAAAFIEVNIQLQGDPARRTIASYTKQLDDLGRKMQATQAALAAKERQLGIVASKGESDPDAARLAALSTGLASVQAQTADAMSRTAASALPDAMSSPVIQGLQGEIARLEAQRRQLAVDAGPNHPQYREVVSQIAALREQMASQEGLIRRAAEAKAAQAKLAQQAISGAVDVQRGQVIQSRAAQNEVAVLQQDLANLRASYDQIGLRRAQLQVLDNTAQTNISLLAPALPNPKAVSPRRLASALGGTAAGLALGVLIAFMLEFVDRRIRSSQQIETWLGIPDLGSIRLNVDERLRLVRFVSGLLPRGSG